MSFNSKSLFLNSFFLLWMSLLIFPTFEYFYSKSMFWLFFSNLIYGFSSFFKKNSSEYRFLTLDLFFFCLFLSLFSFNFFSLHSFIFPVTTQIWFCFLSSYTFFTMIMILKGKKEISKNLESHLSKDNSFLFKSFIAFIEVLSTLIRPFTLALRLTTNIMMGHFSLILLNSMFKNSWLWIFLGQTFFFFMKYLFL